MPAVMEPPRLASEKAPGAVARAASALLRLVKVVAWPAAVIGAVLAWLWLDAVAGWHGPQRPTVGVALILAGSLMVSWCFGLFAFHGEGSPHPYVAKTKRLVITGPYRYVRNPMMWGVGALLIGLALTLGSVGLWFGIALFVVYGAFFVPLHEERDMQRRFGDEYRQYCREVPRWWPRLRARPPQ